MNGRERLDLHWILSDLESYRPRRQGWSWRIPAPGWGMNGLSYRETSQPLANGIPLQAAKAFGDIDPQPAPVITTEIASGRFEDDIRRMRMAAWHGADHIMVIRTAGQSHFDGLIEGTPQGVGGVPITRKQLRAQRKALDLIEDEVGRPINFHSYVSGVAGPEIAVLFVEEGVNGAHQDPQYNILYRNINMIRSFVDAAESKTIMAKGGLLQIDGAHNANATARTAWNVMPELFVQHAINCAFSTAAGMKKELIALSTVPPAAAPAPDLAINLPYAVALRDFFQGYRMRAQMNTKYMESSTREATVTHVMNLLVTQLCGADIQSTITPDEGRNVPWHMYNVEALDTAKQALIAMDGLREFVKLDQHGRLGKEVRELKERAVLFLEEVLSSGGYFQAVEDGFFIDSGLYPERNGDGIARKIAGGIGAGSVVPRDPDYFAPVDAHFGFNNVAQYDATVKNPAELIGGTTFDHPERIVWIDELDPTDNVNVRMQDSEPYRTKGKLKPEVQWLGDGVVVVDLTFPTDVKHAEAAAKVVMAMMGLADGEIIHKEILHPSEGTRIQCKGTVTFDIDVDQLTIPEDIVAIDEETLFRTFRERPMRIVAGTIGEDEHSVGLREIIDIKHGGIEKYGIECLYLGTSVSISKLVDAAIEADAEAVLLSTIISHDEIHAKNMRKVADYCIEKGVREKLILVAGGTQVTDELAKINGMDGGFGRKTKGVHVASFLATNRKRS